MITVASTECKGKKKKGETKIPGTLCGWVVGADWQTAASLAVTSALGTSRASKRSSARSLYWILAGKLAHVTQNEARALVVVGDGDTRSTISVRKLLVVLVFLNS